MKKFQWLFYDTNPTKEIRQNLNKNSQQSDPGPLQCDFEAQYLGGRV